jgi:hypothetical protein
MSKITSGNRSNLINVIVVAALAVCAVLIATQPNYESRGVPATADIESSHLAVFWEKTRTDPVAAYTGVLAVFTLALVIVSSVQIYFLRRSDVTARRSADAALLAAQATSKQGDAAIASERAYIREIVTSTRIDDAIKFAERYDKSPTMGSTKASLFAGCSYKNYGKTPATISDYGLDLVISPTVPPPPPFPLGFSLAESTVAPLAISEEVYISVEREITWILSNSLVRKQTYVWLIGWVHYQDVFGAGHAHEFMWRYDLRLRRFVPKRAE